MNIELKLQVVRVEQTARDHPKRRKDLRRFYNVEECHNHRILELGFIQGCQHGLHKKFISSTLAFGSLNKTIKENILLIRAIKQGVHNGDKWKHEK